MERQIGHEASVEEFIEKLTVIFREIRRCLKRDGICWVNMGDCYAGGGNGGGGSFAKDGIRAAKPGSDKNVPARTGTRGVGNGLKAKDLVGQPWMLAFALRADGWFLRRDIIWSKPNPMPESVADRPTTSHEYIFLLSKEANYFYNAEAILEPCSENTHARISQNVAAQIGSSRAHAGGKTNGNMKACVRPGVNPKAAKNAPGSKQNNSFSGAICMPVLMRNKRSVWTISSKGITDAHFATFPADLVKPCVLAGTRPGDAVIDPFAGSGTVGLVALELGRQAILIELNPDYVDIIQKRTQTTLGLAL